jgi:hypothetical protein
VRDPLHSAAKERPTMTYPNDPNLDGRDGRHASPAGRSYTLWIVGGAALVAVIAFLALGPGNRPGVVQNTGTPPASTSTTTGSGNTASPGGTMQPQGPTGPLTTGSGGAPASSPQGETPPNMQTTPRPPTSR